MLQERATRAAERVVQLALESSFNGELMNQATGYILDQHRLAIRLRDAPSEARAVLLRKKEEIFRARAATRRAHHMPRGALTT